jgi:hypothetical protein
MNELALFDVEPPVADAPAEPSSAAVDYVPTPAWLAYAMVERKLANVGDDAVILEPTAGDGAILREIPQHLRAFGIELDPALAAEARATTGREVIIGDVLTTEIPYVVTHVIGNPPFSVAWLNAFLERFHAIMPEGGEITLLLPAFALQTSARVAAYHRRYSIVAEMIPRDVFPGFDKAALARQLHQGATAQARWAHVLRRDGRVARDARRVPAHPSALEDQCVGRRRTPRAAKARRTRVGRTDRADHIRLAPDAHRALAASDSQALAAVLRARRSRRLRHSALPPGSRLNLTRAKDFRIHR